MELLRGWLGIGWEARDLNALQVTLRGVVIFVSALIMVRVSARRFLGRKSAFDVILALILASMLARAINGSAPLAATIVAGFVLVFLHRLMAMMAYRWSGFGTLIKGTDDVVIKDGKFVREAMRKNHLTEADLCEDLRLQSCEDADEVKVARLERSGELSAIRQKC